MAGGAPVLRSLFAVDQALFQQAQKEHLFPAIVFRAAGGDFARPVIGIAQPLQLGAHIVDIGVSPLGRVHMMLDGRVFSGQAEGVPTHGVQHVEALHAFAARHHVAYGIVAHMTHVYVARWIGKHLQYIIFGLVALVRDGEGFLLTPAGLPFFFDSLRIIAFLRHVRTPWADYGLAARATGGTSRPLSRALAAASRMPLMKFLALPSPNWPLSSRASLMATLGGTSCR